MVATLPFIAREFERLNAMCFGGELVPPFFALSRSCRAAGQLRFKRYRTGRRLAPEEYTLCVSTRFDLPEDELGDIVLHEMIHYYIESKGLRDTSAHGRLFRGMMARVNRLYGRNVRVSIRQAAAPERVGDGRIYVFCLARMEDGALGVTVSARTRVRQVDAGLRRCYRLRAVRWYVSADPFFARYPRSLTPRLYHISEEEAEQHVAQGAQELDL